MMCRPLALCLLLGVVAGTEDVTCRDDQGEDTALLQKPAVKCTHGWYWHGHCRCLSGWAGTACDTAEELFPHTEEEMKDECGDDFTVYPFAEQSNWATNYKGWEDCGNKAQSPINIVWGNYKVNRTKKLSQTLGKNTGLYTKNNGNTMVKVESKSNFGKVVVNGEDFFAAQFHIHTPGEHKVNGWLPAAELHIVSLNEDQSAATVVGIMFRIGKPNKCLNKFTEEVPTAGCKTKIGSFDLSCFEHEMSGPFWRYEGSLTTPPCSEIVTWNVMKRVATISRKQLRALRSRYPRGNNRNVQPLYGRKVTLMGPC